MKNSSFFFKVLIIFLNCFLSISYAEEEWTIKSNENLSYALVSGEVTHGDTLGFFIRKSENCKKIWNTVSVYTYKTPNDFNQLLNKNIPIEVNGRRVSASIQDVKPFLMGHRVILSLGHFPVKEYTYFLKEFYDEFQLYQIQIVDDENFEASKYFDIKVNNWKLNNLVPSILEAYDKCNQLLLSKS